MNFLAALVLTAQPPAVPAVQPTSNFRDPLKHLVVDTRVVESTEGARLAPGPVEKFATNPLFRADKPWENSLNNLYPNVVYDPTDALFKMWYKCVLVDKDAIAKMGPAKTLHDVGWYLCYATSKNGVAWEKPDLGRVSFDGSAKTNIVARDVANVGVFRDARDPDPARRFKMIYDAGIGKMRVRFSADGLRWGDEVGPEGLGQVGDTHSNAFWDTSRARYVLHTKRYDGERLIYRSESKDFLTWTEPRLALRSTAEEGKRLQTYCLCPFEYGNGYLGWAMMYAADGPKSVDCELVWSPDGVAWTRVFPGKPFIARGGKGTSDAMCVYAQANPPVLVDDRLLVFYGGSETPHVGWKRHCLPCLAKLRPNGFAGYEPAEPGKAAIIHTRLLKCVGEPLRVSADAGSAGIRIAVVGEPGFTLADCLPVKANVTDGEVRWKGGKSLADLNGKRVRLRVEIAAGRLYSLRGVQAVE